MYILFITFVFLGERPFVCPYKECGRSFTTSNIRKVHLRTHTGEKPYHCEIEGCGRTFASATNYKNHSRIHTGKTCCFFYYEFKGRQILFFGILFYTIRKYFIFC